MNFSLGLSEQNCSRFHVSVSGHLHRSAFVLHEEYDEFRRFSLACVPPNDVDIIRAFVEGLTRCQSHFLSASHLHHDRAFQHINKRMCIVAMYWVRTSGGYSTVTIRPSLPGNSVRSFDMSCVTLASCATSVLDMRHACAKISFVNVIN